jgi:stringent starvation protein B
MSMTSHRPYMVRALYEWILDNECTPYILVNAHETGVEVPQNFVKDGQIVLNISPTAVQGLLIANEGLEFNGRFGGIPMRVYVPSPAIMGIYAKENGQGMIFELGGDSPRPQPPASAGGKDGPAASGTAGKEKPAAAKPSLRVVK